MIACVLVATGVMTACTRWGLALSSDSARYVRTSRHILGVEPVVDIDIESKGEQAHYPPFYPITLAAAGFVLRQDPLHAARWLHVAIFAGSTLLTGALVRRFGGRTWAAIFAAAVIALSPVTITTHAWLLSEALFILLALGMVWLLAMYLDELRPHAAAPRRDEGVASTWAGWALLIAAGLVASLGMLTRYAGAALGPAAVLALLVLPRESPWRRRVLDAAVFSLVSLALPMVQFGRNLVAGGSVANRTIALHPISLDHLKDGVAAVATWIAPLGITGARDAANAQPVLAAAAVLLFATIFLSGCALAWRGRREAIGRLAGVLVLVIVCFVGLLVFSISFVDFHTPMDTRVLSPVFAGWIVLAGCVLSWWIGPLGRGHRMIAVAATAVIAAIMAWPSDSLVSRLWTEGDGFAHPQWRNSATMAAVRDLPAELQIFTNAPGAVYLLSGRQFIWTVPAEISASSRLPNPQYAGLMARIDQEIRAGRGVMVWLHRYGRRRAYYPSAEQVRSRLGLRVRRRFNDGAIYDAPAK